MLNFIAIITRHVPQTEELSIFVGNPANNSGYNHYQTRIRNQWNTGKLSKRCHITESVSVLGNGSNFGAQ